MIVTNNAKNIYYKFVNNNELLFDIAHWLTEVLWLGSLAHQ